MSTTLPVQLLVSVNGGSFLPGTQSGGFTQTVALKAASTAQLTSVRYEITDYPIGFGVPAGWSVDPVTNAYFFAPSNVTVTPPTFSIGTSGPNNWGLFMFRLRGNNNPLQLNADGTPNTSYSPQLTDTSGCVDVPSPNLGMQGLAAGLTTHLDTMRGWIGPLMQALRLADNVAGGGGPFTAGGDLSGTSISQVVQKVHGATVPTAGALTTGAVLQVSGPSSLSYAAVNLALAAAVTGILPVVNGGTGLSGVGANGTVLTVVSGAPAWVAPAASGFTAGGDLSGTATSQNVLAVHGAAVPIAGALTTGNTLQVTGVSTLGYGPLNLAGGPNFVTGVLPAANQAAQTMGGDVTGTATASVVARVNGATVPASGALTVGNVLQASGASALSYGPINLANPAAAGGSLGVANGGTGLSALGSADQLLGMNHAGSGLAFFTAGGDVTLASAAFKVVALQGFSVATTTPTTGQVLTWNAGTSKWTATTPGGAGSVTGSGVWHSTSGTLDGAASHGTAGQFLLTNSAATDTPWTSLSGDVTASTGTPGQITVTALQAHAVASTAPTEGQFLIQGASSWAPTSLSGDVTASVVTPGLLTVVALQTFGVATTTPTSGQVLAWNAGTSKWTPTTAGAGAAVTGSGFWHSASGTLDAAASKGTAGQFAVTNAAATDAIWVTLSGDTTNSTGTAGAITVTGIRGNPVSVTTPTSGQVLVENAAATGSAWTTWSGDVSLSTSTPGLATVLAVHGATIPAAGALVTGNAPYVSGVSALTYSALNLAGGSGWVTGSLPATNGGTGLSALGSADQLLGMNHAGSALAYFTTAGDLTLASGNFTVVALQTFGVANTTPTANQALVWNSGTSKWTPTTLAAAGSVTGSGVWHSTSGSLDPAASKGTAGQALFTNAAATDTAWTTLSGDVSASIATVGQITVTALQGHAVANTAPTEGLFLIQGASSWGPVALSGDVSASITTPGLLTVVALQGFGVATATPTSGQVLAWNSGTSKWTPTTTGAGASVTGSGVWHSASGVLDGAASKGTAGQALFTNAAATDTAWTTLSGDVAASLTTVGQITVTRIQGNPVSGTAATAGQFLVENAAATGSAWASLSGDVSNSAGTPGQLTVLKVNGASVPAGGALTVGNAPYVSGVSALTYSALNLAGGSGWVTGALPATNGGTGLNALGTADQLLGVNHAGSALAYFTAAGDVSLNTGAFTVIGIRANSIPTLAAGFLQWTGSAFAWSAATTAITGSGVWHNTSGTLDSAAFKGTAGQALFTNAAATDTAWATIGGDLTASLTTPGSITVSKINGTSIPAGGALVTGNAPYVSGPTALTYSALNLAGGSGWVTGSLPASNGGTGLSAIGTADQLLGVNHAGSALNFFTLSQDGSISGGALTITGIRANNIPALAAGFLQWTGAAFAWSSAPVSVTGSGVWHSTSGALDSAASKGTAGQFLVTNTGATDTAWASIAGDATGSTGTPGSLTVTAIRGNTVSATAATAGQVLVENASATGSAWTTFTGDVTLSVATPGLTTVGKVNGASVPAAGALTTGNGLYVSGVSALTYSALNLAGGAGWVTGSLPAANGGTGLSALGTADQLLGMNHAGSALAYFTAGGDLTLASGNFTVAGIRGNALAAPSGTNTTILWNGSALSWGSALASSAPGTTLVFQPGGTPSANVFTTWSSLFTAAGAVSGPIVVFFDGAFNAGACTVPSGTYAFTNPLVTFAGGGVTVTATATTVTFATGCVISGVQRFSRATFVNGGTSPVFTYNSDYDIYGYEAAVFKGAASAPLFRVTGTAHFILNLFDYSQLAGTNVVIDSTSSMPSFVTTNNSAVVFAGTVGASGLQISINSVASIDNSGRPRGLNTSAALLGYNDALVSPAIGVTQVQAAIDYLKSHIPAAAITQLTGDVLAGPGSGSQAATVVAISGTSPLPIHPNQLQWIQGATPTWGQAQQANGAAPASMTIAPQAPGASPTSTANGTPGSVLVALAAPGGGGANAALTVSDGGSNVVSIGKNGSNGAITWAAGIAAAAMLQLTATSNVAAAAMTVQAQSAFASATGSNRNGGAVFIQGGQSAAGGLTGGVELLTGDSACGIIVGPTDVNFVAAPTGNYAFGSGVGNGGGHGIVTLAIASANPTSAPSSGGVFLWATGGSQLNAWASSFSFASQVASPILSHANLLSDVASTNFSIVAQGALVSATTHKDGGHLLLQGGIAASGGAPGSVLIQDGGLNYKISATSTLASMQNAGGTIVAEVVSGGIVLAASKSAISITDSTGDVLVQTNVPGTPTIRNFVGTTASGTTSSQAGTRRLFCQEGQISSNGGSITLTIPVDVNTTAIINFNCLARIVTAGGLDAVNDSMTINGTCSFRNNAGSLAPFGGGSGNVTIISQQVIGAAFIGGTTNEVIATPSGSNAQIQYEIASGAGTLGTADCTIWAEVFYN